MYIRNKKMQNGKNYYILEDRLKVEGKYITRNIRYLGTAKRLLSDIKELDKLKKRKP